MVASPEPASRRRALSPLDASALYTPVNAWPCPGQYHTDVIADYQFNNNAVDTSGVNHGDDAARDCAARISRLQPARAVLFGDHRNIIAWPPPSLLAQEQSRVTSSLPATETGCRALRPSSTVHLSSP